MNLVMMTEGTGQGVHGRKTNVSRLYDLLVENGNQRINLEAGPGTHAFRHLGGTFFGADAMSIVNHHQNWILEPALARGLKTIQPSQPPQPSQPSQPFLVHDSLREPTNGWGFLDPVKRIFDGIRRHPLCERI